jgi:hypothetical protein
LADTTLAGKTITNAQTRILFALDIQTPFQKSTKIVNIINLVPIGAGIFKFVVSLNQFRCESPPKGSKTPQALTQTTSTFAKSEPWQKANPH